MRHKNTKADSIRNQPVNNNNTSLSHFFPNTGGQAVSRQTLSSAGHRFVRILRLPSSKGVIHLLAYVYYIITKILLQQLICGTRVINTSF